MTSRILLTCLLAAPVFAQPAAQPAKQVPPARIVSFTAAPSTVNAGQPVVLTWSTENPNNVTISGIGKVTARGTRQVTPAATTTYTLTVTGPGNTTLTRDVKVTVNGTLSSSAKQDNGKLPDGKPDFTGVYDFAGLRNPNPPDLKPGAEKFRIVRAAERINGNTTITNGSDCNPLGIPQSFVTPYPFQIIHTTKQLVMLFEYPNTFRIIPTDGRPHTEDPDPTFMGEGVARWDGDTLVVDSIGFNDKTEVNGFMHTESLHVVERYTKVPEGLRYEVTVEDPNVWTAPWVMPARVLPLRPDLDKVDEFVCEKTPDYSKYFAK
ncbi:MAG: hypothetical protein RL328_2438 [Acidobacteriota bacterium]|jgi:plastocyanin